MRINWTTISQFREKTRKSRYIFLARLVDQLTSLGIVRPIKPTNRNLHLDINQDGHYWLPEKLATSPTKMAPLGVRVFGSASVFWEISQPVDFWQDWENVGGFEKFLSGDFSGTIGLRNLPQPIQQEITKAQNVIFSGHCPIGSLKLVISQAENWEITKVQTKMPQIVNGIILIKLNIFGFLVSKAKSLFALKIELLLNRETNQFLASRSGFP